MEKLMKEIRTTKLFEELNSISKNNQSYQAFLNDRKEEKQYTTLNDFLNDYLAKHPEHTIPDIIFRSNLSQNYVYPILNGNRSHPSKYKLVALCIGACMDLKNTQRALTLAECSELYPKIPADAGIILCINNGCETVMDVESFLIENGVESPFG